MSTGNSVILKSFNNAVREEAICDGTPLPGHLLKIVSTGHFAVHATAGGNAQKRFAIEDELQGKDITTAYTVSTLCQAVIAQSGEFIQARLKASENVAIGDYLESAGNGTLQVVTADSADLYNQNVVAVAREASNVGTVARIAVQIV